MSGLTIGAIAEALKAQLVANLTRETNVYAYPVDDPKGPSITIEPADELVEYWGTFGAGGLATVRFNLRLDPAAGDPQSMFIRLYDYLSVGIGNNSSVIDALMADRSLGGVVGDCVPLTVSVNAGDVTASVGVQIMVNKVGAEVG